MAVRSENSPHFCAALLLDDRYLCPVGIGPPRVTEVADRLHELDCVNEWEPLEGVIVALIAHRLEFSHKPVEKELMRLLEDLGLSVSGGILGLLLLLEQFLFILPPFRIAKEQILNVVWPLKELRPLVNVGMELESVGGLLIVSHPRFIVVETLAPHGGIVQPLMNREVSGRRCLVAAFRALV